MRDLSKNINLDYDDFKTIHEMILFQRMVDHKNRRKYDLIDYKIISHMELLDAHYRTHLEDVEDKPYRKKIVKWAAKKIVLLT